MPRVILRPPTKIKYTFNVDPNTAFLVMSHSKSRLRTALFTGQYRYVESKFCLNAPRYIAYDEKLIPHLTEYAHNHLDECCIAFHSKLGMYLREMPIDNQRQLRIVVGQKGACIRHFQNKKFESKRRIYAVVRQRPVRLRITFDAHLVLQAKGGKATDKEADAQNKQVSNILANGPHGFGAVLCYIMNVMEYTEEQLSESSGVSVKTISDLRKENSTRQPALKTVMRLCVGMKLPEDLSLYLLEESGYVLKPNNNRDMAYKYILKCKNRCTIDECNEFLVKTASVPKI